MIWDWKVILIVAAVTSIVIILSSGITVLLAHRLKGKPKWLAKRRYILELLLYFCAVAALILIVVFAVIVSLYPDTSSSTSAIAQVIAAAGVTVAAGAALWSILKTRPLAVRAVEKHSDDLNKFISEWITELKRINLHPYEKPREGQNVDIINRIEQKPLFIDFANHLPSGITLLQDWQQFYHQALEYEKASLYLWNRIKIKLEQSTKLLCEGIISDKAGFLHPMLVGAVYEDSLLLAEKKPQSWLDRLTQDIKIKRHGEITDVFLLWLGDDALASTSTRAEANLASDVLRSIIGNLRKSDVDEADYVVRARSIIELREKAVSLRSGILNTMNELQLIAIFPGNCKYLGHTRK